MPTAALPQNPNKALRGTAGRQPTQLKASHPQAKLTLLVYNYAHVDPRSLAQSEDIASAIFGNIGITTIWPDCPVSKSYTSATSGCQIEMRPDDLVLRILPRQMADKLHSPDESLGLAQSCSDHEPACPLNVFYHRLDQLAAEGYRADRILAYAIAHEVAHVLIGPKHSEQGIMRGKWTPKDLQYISLGLDLNFTAEQCRQLRDAVLRRSFSPAQFAEEAKPQLLVVE